jgi:hypothetical protein
MYLNVTKMVTCKLILNLISETYWRLGVNPYRFDKLQQISFHIASIRTMTEFILFPFDILTVALISFPLRQSSFFAKKDTNNNLPST